MARKSYDAPELVAIAACAGPTEWTFAHSNVVAEVIEVSPAQTDGGRDGVRFRYDTINQNGDKVMTATSLHFLKRRPQGDPK